MRQLNNITNERTVPFWINDISLFVPPTSISVHKEGLNYSIKSLRTKSSVKMASGNGVYHIQLNFVFPPDSFLQLHRLICQVKNNPFVYLENDFLHDSLNNDVLNKKGKKIIYATLMGLNISNHPTSPGTFTVEIDLRYFNEKVYSESLGFKQDDLYEFATDEKIYNVSFDIFNSDIINIVEEEEKGIVGSSRFRSRYSLNNSIRKDTIKVVSPYESRVYKRYCNYLQILYLKKYFNINIDRKKDTSKEGFIIDEIDASLYIKKEIANLLNRGTVGLHEIEIPFSAYNWDSYNSGSLDGNIVDADFKRLRQEIIHACYLTSKFTKFYVRTFSSLKIPAEDLKSITNILNQGVTSSMTRKEKQEKKKGNLESLRSVLVSLGKNQKTSSRSDRKHVRKFVFEKGKSRSLLTGGTENEFNPDAEDFKLMLDTYIFTENEDDFDPNNDNLVERIKNSPAVFQLLPDKGSKYTNINFVQEGYLKDDISSDDLNALAGYTSWKAYREGKIVVCSAYVNEFSFVFAPCDCTIIAIDKEDSYGDSIKLKADDGNIIIKGIVIPDIFRKTLIKYIDKKIPGGTILGFALPEIEGDEPVSSFAIYISRTLFKKLPLYKTDKTPVSEYKRLVEGSAATIEKLDELFLYINNNYQKYLGRKEVENVFMSERVMSILDFTDYEINQISNMSEGFLGNDFTYGDKTVIANFSGALRNIVANIPILGQEVPTHQFLGSIEPSYQFNFIGKNNFKSMPTTLLELEKMRSDSQYYAKSFSMIPGASFIGVESLITKILGSYEKSYRNVFEYEENGYISRNLTEKYNFSINSMDTYTIQGQPHATGMNFRFDETRDYNEEEIRPAFTNQTNRKSVSDLYKKLVEGVPLNSSTQKTKTLSIDSSLYKNVKIHNEIYDESAGWGKWKTKHYTANEYYRKIRFVEKSSGNSNGLNQYMNSFDSKVKEHNLSGNLIHPDKSAFYISQVMSQIEDYLQILYKNKPKSRIFSAIRYTEIPNISIIKKDTGEDDADGNRIFIRRKGDPRTVGNDEEIVKTYRSMHFTGGAIDIYRKGVNVTELAIYIYFMQLFNFIKDPLPNSSRSMRFLGMGVYGKDAYSHATLMEHSIGEHGFVHLDLNYKVKEASLTDEKSLYVEAYFKNSLRYWYGKHGKDRYQKDQLDIFSILLSCNDPKQRKFPTQYNSKLQSLGFRTLDEYVKRLLAAHDKLINDQGDSTNVNSLIEEFRKIAGEES